MTTPHDRLDIEAIYALSPMQQGMLFHSLYDQESGVYVEQLAATLHGSLDVTAFRRAWQLVMQRHAVLRTAFAWKRLDEMRQVVHRNIAPPLSLHDWREFSPAAQEKHLQAFMEAERRQGFDLAKAPLMRLALMQLAADRHYFVWSHHHTLLDGWSLPIVLNEVLQFYEAFRRDSVLRLPAPRPYQDYINWLEQQDEVETEAFWREQLRGFATRTPLPGAHLPVRSQQAERHKLELSLSAETTTQLQNMTRRLGLTLSTVLQGAWGLLLSRYSGEKDVLFGLTVSGRPAELSGVEGMVGLFINTIPVRLQVDESVPISAWLLAHQQHSMALRQFEHAPLARIQQWSQLPPGSNLFDSILVFENYPQDEANPAENGGLVVSDLHSAEFSHFPLALISAPATELVLRLIYDPARFAQADIEILLRHLANLLRGMPADANQPISELSLLDEAERTYLIRTWNETTHPLPEGLCLPQWFEAQVERMPDAVAVESDEQSLSYRELNERANQLAHHLLGLGVQPDELVGVMAERTPELVTALLAVLKAGGAYVPIDPSYPQERIAIMLADSGVRIVLSQERLLSVLPAHSAHTICLDSIWEQMAAEPVHNPSPQITPANLAYVIYTSGSTGRPKGVMIHHEGVVNYLSWCQRTYPLASGAGSPVHSSISFDLTVTSLFAPLVSGGRVRLVSEEQGIEGLAAAMSESEGFSLVKITPAHLELLAEQIPADQAAGRTHAFIIGGEALLPGQIAYWQRHAPGTALYNEYGPTETVVGCCVYRVPETERDLGVVPIGRPVINTQLYVLDEHFELAPMGVAGELFIAGMGVGRGYHKRAGLTAERFMPDPFSDQAGARMYRSGDLVRHLANGELEYLGRLDNQVKVRGYRIELGEIEVVLSQQEQVGEAVVLVREDAPGEKRLVAYVSPAGEDELDVGELRRALQRRLPDYMQPTAYVVLASLPLTPNGKVDRKALAALEDFQSPVAGRYRAPRSPVEEMLVELWSRILRVQRPGIDDNFFELGGHSLLATQLVSRVRDVFQVDLPMRRLFETPTVASVAEFIEADLREEREGTGAIPVVSRDGDIPLSYAQQRFWFLNQLQPDSPFYNVPMVLRLQGKLDIDALQQSLNEIVRRHESLRTAFQNRHGEPLQLIVDELQISLPVDDMTAILRSEGEQAVENRIRAEMQQPFDLEQGPLLRSRLFKVAAEEHIAVVSMHHIISDAWSLDVFLREMAILYDAFSHQRPSPLPDLTIQYVDYSAWQRSWLQGAVLERQLNYWRDKLKDGAVLLDLPTDRPRPAVQTANGANFAFSLPVDLAEHLRDFSRREGVTLFMTLLAAFQALLYRYTQQEDINIGSPIANRSRGEVEQLIGLFLNTLVLRTDLSGNPSFGDLVKRVRTVALEAYAHQDLPFEMLVEQLQPQRSLSHSPLFQVGFTLQNAADNEVPLSDLAISPVLLDSGTAKYDITLLMADSETGLAANFEYNTDLFDRSTIERMAGHFTTLLQGVMADPGMAIDLAPLLSADEQQQLLVDWNDTAMPTPTDHCIHELFERQVVQRPNATAVTFEGRALTYEQLNRKANQLAHYLRKLGVGPETLVAIATERSLEMAVGIMGTLKAGGAYLPIDPTYPLNRIAFMFTDSGAPILLTQDALAGVLPENGAQIIRLDEDWSLIALEPETNPDPAVRPENTAYVIYTSGSTGRPKGAALRHRGLSNLAEVQRLAFDIHEGSRVLQFAPLSFDASVWETVMALANGGTLCLARQSVLSFGPELLRFLRDERITTVTLPPSVLTVLSSQELPDLQVIVAAGEKCTAEIVQEWAPGRRFFNAYGPTETTVCASMHLCSPDDLQDPPIGRPIGNCRLYVVDPNLQILPLGVPGELVVGGVNVGRGYLNRPELTEEKFLADPFGGPDDKLYRTGDLVRYRKDGNIEFLGRIDHQVKVRGFRIELGEIESLLRQHDSVRDAVVVARTFGENKDKRLVAYLLVEEGVAPELAELRTYLQQHLPDYMTPSHFVFLDEFPLSPAGKVDRKSLPAPDSDRSAVETEYVAPCTETEEILATISADLLAIDQVGVNDDFFELGGHSLLATQFISRVREAFDVEVELRTLFERPTVALIAEDIDKLKQEKVQQTDTISDLLAQLDQLSDDQVLEMLEQTEGRD